MNNPAIIEKTFDTTKAMNKALQAWERRQKFAAEGDTPAEFLGSTSDLTVMGNTLILFRKPKAGLERFLSDARAMGMTLPE